MTYSCGIHTGPGESLEQAQYNKIDAVRGGAGFCNKRCAARPAQACAAKQHHFACPCLTLSPLLLHRPPPAPRPSSSSTPRAWAPTTAFWRSAAAGARLRSARCSARGAASRA
jgi:hypothetical protein